MARKFDLNMDDVLEAWNVSDGIREVIANALDEKILSDTKDVEIYEDDEGRWHVRDYGRGLKPENLKQDEDEEKLQHPDEVIGKFGVGLKDALATFYRNNVDVKIKSQYCTIGLSKSQKHGFDSIETLHAIIEEPENPEMRGTDIILEGAEEEDIEKAKNNFLKYTDDETLEETKYGQVLEKKGDTARIYISGLKVAEEENFLFSYNITNTTKKLRDAMNRERSNVGRTAYSRRVKQILQECESGDVANLLVSDLQKFQEGTMHDELEWKPVSTHACKILNAEKEVIFVTPLEMQIDAEVVDKAKRDGREVITVPRDVKDGISGKKDISGNRIEDISGFLQTWDESFEFEWVSEDDMTQKEKEIWRMRNQIFELIGGKPSKVDAVKVSETMRVKEIGDTRFEPTGLWQPGKSRIVIKRSQLSSLDDFAGTLLHEATHATSGHGDVSREFELALTNRLGEISTQNIEG
ncbi:MAG: ATP-binding protein [Candidatus Nanohaloarchaea archaeon]